MKTIGQLISSQNTNNAAEKSRTLCYASSPKMTEEQRKEVLRRYNPDRQMEICSHLNKCIFGNYPTLADLRYHFGENMPSTWLLPQLFNLSEFCGCKDKITTRQIEETATMITQNYYYLKVSELMLFFYRFKAGRYGRFYGAVDPMLILTSLQRFVKEDRNAAIDHRETEARTKQREADSQRAISREQYLALKERALNGDNEALQALTPPNGEPQETLKQLQGKPLTIYH